MAQKIASNNMLSLNCDHRRGLSSRRDNSERIVSTTVSAPRRCCNFRFSVAAPHGEFGGPGWPGVKRPKRGHQRILGRQFTTDFFAEQVASGGRQRNRSREDPDSPLTTTCRPSVHRHQPPTTHTKVNARSYAQACD